MVTPGADHALDASLVSEHFTAFSRIFIRQRRLPRHYTIGFKTIYDITAIIITCQKPIKPYICASSIVLYMQVQYLKKTLPCEKILILYFMPGLAKSQI